MKINNFDWFLNREKNNPCLILGTAPNMTNFPFKTFNGKIITFGDGMIRGEGIFNPDYYISANDLFPIPDVKFHLEIINNLPKTIFLFSDSVIYSNYYTKNNEYLDDNIKSRWFMYDQRHFNKQKCIPESICCHLLKEPNREITIQEYISKKFGVTNHYSVGSTIAIHAFALALIMGCNPIIFNGVEIPITYKKKWSSNSKADSVLKKTNENFIDSLPISKFQKIIKKLPESIKIVLKNIHNPKKIFLDSKKSVFLEDIASIMCDFQFLTDIASSNNIEVLVSSKTSSLNNVIGIKYKNPFNN
jgi:hypothetical protein